MDRYFEKISYNQFCKDIKVDDSLYEEYELPKRATIGSCGYDFYAIEDMILHPGEIKKIPTGYKAKFNTFEMLMLVVMGFKYNVRMCNQVGIIDSDYYNNIDNEGHIWVKLQNHGDVDYVIKKGDAFAQGIIMKYMVCDDDNSFGERIGGIGSTDRREENGK